jgi:DNA polymerase-3 subunit alpha
MSFVHLRVHSEYSLVDGVVRVDELVAACASGGMPAVAITDQGNLFSMVKFYKAAQGKGIKPVVGVDLWVRAEGASTAPVSAAMAANAAPELHRLTLLCQNLVGYRNLTRLVSRTWLEGQQKGVPTCERNWLTAEATQGLIALSGAREGDVGRALLGGKPDEAVRLLQGWLRLFGDRYYLEVQRTGRPQEETLIDATLELVREVAAPLVATNDVRFLAQDDFEAHEARVCIHEGRQLADNTRPRVYTDQQYLRTPSEMRELFSDLLGACDNTLAIARRCSLEVRLGKSFLPEYPVPDGMTTAQFLRDESVAGLNRRLAALEAAPQLVIRPLPRVEYDARLQLELDCICNMGFEGYFLIVADFIRWSRENGVPVGPGRGSGAGSLVAYVLGITDLDPLQHDLLFERFLNPERVSMPDFDVDFCMEGRDRVIEYVAQKYGRERVSQIITYGTMAAKAVVRDAGRVLGQGYGFCDRIAKLIPFEIGIELKDALEKEEELKKLYETDADVREVIDLAMKLEGLTRNAGMHAGGVVIAPSVLTDFAPLYCEEGGGSVVTQFDKDDVEAAGLVKFDFLGLRTLTVIDWALRSINRKRALVGEPPLDVNLLPLDDAPTYELLKACKTTAVFQLESRGMKDLEKRLQPDCFNDIVALVALFRPGPLESGMVDDYVDRKHGRVEGPIDYLHPKLTGILKPTHGVILYQEQVMQIAQVLAGYTLGGADMLRRAMGKKKPEEMAKQRSIFVEGAVGLGVEEANAAYIFDLMEKFAGYGFNKSHSAAYALLSYQTAWLKVHYPADFMAAVLSSDMDKTDKVVTLIDEAKAMGLVVLPPDVNHSDFQFTVPDPRTIRYGLGAVKGVGEGAVASLMEERKSRPFADLANLCQRLDLQKANRRTLEALIKAGCMDSFGHTRATLMESLPAAMQLGEQKSRAATTGQNDLFGGFSVETAPEVASVALKEMPEWSERERLQGERDTLGLYLTGHPLDEFRVEAKAFTSGRLVEVGGAPKPVSNKNQWSGGKQATIAGLVLEVRKRQNRTILLLDDGSARMEVTLFDDLVQQHRDLVQKDALVLVEGQLRYDDFIDDWRLQAKKMHSLQALRERDARRLVIRWPEGTNGHGPKLVKQLEEAMRPHRAGRCAVSVQYSGEPGSARVDLGEAWSVKPVQALLEKVGQIVGRDGWKLVYAPRLE